MCPSKQFSLIFLPDSLRDTLSLKGWMLLVAFFVYEGVNLFRPLRSIDHAGHIGGMLVGLASAQMMEKPAPRHGDRPGGPLHGVIHDIRNAVRAYLEGDERKLQAAKKGRGDDLGGE